MEIRGKLEGRLRASAMISIPAPTTAAQMRTPRSARAKWGHRLPLLLYVLTGFGGLVAEQGFEKYVSLLVGATASASAAVLFTYFLGFALGSLAAARYIRTGRVRRPLLAYGIIELLVGVSCVIFAHSFHSVMEWIAPIQNVFSDAAMKFQVRFAFGCLLVLPSAALMGASFPLIVRALDTGDFTGRKRWSEAYSANLAGAFLAAVVTPIAVVPVIGLRGALWVCFATGVVVCAAAALFSQPAVRMRTASTVARRPLAGGVRLLLAASFASGLVFFALEVIWTHLIGVVIGASIYAFSWMLASVLLGLLMGASMVNSGVRTGQQFATSTLFLCCTGSLSLQFLLWGYAPCFFTITPPEAFQDSFYFAEAFKFAVTAILIVPSSALLGLIYPRLLASTHFKGEEDSYIAGYVNAANAIGCLSGALAGIFVLVPRLGSEMSLKLIIAALALFWLLFLFQETTSTLRRLQTLAAVLVICGLIAAAHWDWRTLTAGLGNYFGQKPAPSDSASTGVKYLPPSMVFRHEDVQGGVTTVMEQRIETPEVRRDVLTMFTNGKFQGDDNPAGEQNAQFGFACIPSLFTAHKDRALLIGLGTGHTGTALRHLGYRRIDIAEFAAGIVKAAGQCYSRLNEGILSAPGVEVLLEDGRNVLLTNPQRTYDLITIEISSIWFAGSTNLYSKEFYELARRRLNPGGVLQQWVQLHHIGPREIACNLATARSVFPYVSLWFYGGQGMLLASGTPMTRSRDLASRLHASGFPADDAARLVDSLARSELLGEAGISQLVGELKPVINSDHNRWIEYASPRYQSSSFDWLRANLDFLSHYR